jgi:hypothetical protein
MTVVHSSLLQQVRASGDVIAQRDGNRRMKRMRAFMQRLDLVFDIEFHTDAGARRRLPTVQNIRSLSDICGGQSETSRRSLNTTI